MPSTCLVTSDVNLDQLAKVVSVPGFSTVKSPSTPYSNHWNQLLNAVHSRELTSTSLKGL